MNEYEIEMEVSANNEPDISDAVDHEADNDSVTGTAITTVTSDNYYQFEQETATQIIGGFSALTFDLGVVIGLLLFNHLVRRWFV